MAELYIALFFVLGMLVGFILTVIATRVKAVGHLHINKSDPEDGPYVFLELTSDLNCLAKKDYVILKVDFPQE